MGARYAPRVLLALSIVASAIQAQAQIPTPSGPASGGPKTGSFAASSAGTVYYWVGCENWRAISPANIRWFATVAEAEAAGYMASTARGCASPESRTGPTPLDTGQCTVQRVIDGDTILCAEAAERIRLLLIDAPELSQGELGESAREWLVERLPLGVVVRVERDVQARDPYGRILAYLYSPNGSMINESLLRAGYGVVSIFPPNVRYVDRLRVAQDEARRERRGLWAVSAFDCMPADHRIQRCD